jgi:hypothetical protein
MSDHNDKRYIRRNRGNIASKLGLIGRIRIPRSGSMTSVRESANLLITPDDGGDMKER